MKNIFEIKSVDRDQKVLLTRLNFNHKEKRNKAILIFAGEIIANISENFKEKYSLNIIINLKDHSYNEELDGSIISALKDKFSMEQINAIFELKEYTEILEVIENIVQKIKNNITKEQWDVFFSCYEEYITQSRETFNEDVFVPIDKNGYMKRYNMRDTKYNFPQIYQVSTGDSGIIKFRSTSPLLDLGEKTVQELVAPFETVFSNFKYTVKEKEIIVPDRSNKITTR